MIGSGRATAGRRTARLTAVSGELPPAAASVAALPGLADMSWRAHGVLSESWSGTPPVVEGSNTVEEAGVDEITRARHAMTIQDLQRQSLAILDRALKSLSRGTDAVPPPAQSPRTPVGPFLRAA